MKLKEGSVLYVRTDYAIEGKEAAYQDITDSVAYLQGLASQRYLLAGVLGDIETQAIDGGLAVYEAKDLEEAKKLAQEDPLISRGFYRAEVRKWNIMILPQEDSE